MKKYKDFELKKAIKEFIKDSFEEDILMFMDKLGITDVDPFEWWNHEIDGQKNKDRYLWDIAYKTLSCDILWEYLMEEGYFKSGDDFYDELPKVFMNTVEEIRKEDKRF